VFELELEPDVSTIAQSVDDSEHFIKWNRVKTTSKGVNNSMRRRSRRKEGFEEGETARTLLA
jgi:hypothetical protein